MEDNVAGFNVMLPLKNTSSSSYNSRRKKHKHSRPRSKSSEGHGTAARGRVSSAKEKQRKLWSHFGLNERLYSEMFEKQGYVCSICKEPLTPYAESTVINYDRVADYKDLPPIAKRTHVRALLCRSCDAGLRMFRSSEAALIDAVVFLRTH